MLMSFRYLLIEITRIKFLNLYVFFLTQQFLKVFNLTWVDFSVGCPDALFPLLSVSLSGSFVCFSSNFEDA